MVSEALSEALGPEELQRWLEWSGATLLAMRLSSPAPREHRTAWPEYALDSNAAYGYTGERLRPAVPRSHEIQLMDEILRFPLLIVDVPIRRLVNARALVAPISNRHLYSWTKLGYMLHTDRRKVMRLHNKGLCEIVAKLPEAKIYAVRHSMAAHT